jgi:hypothetical protein
MEPHWKRNAFEPFSKIFKEDCQFQGTNTSNLYRHNIKEFHKNLKLAATQKHSTKGNKNLNVVTKIEKIFVQLGFSSKCHFRHSYLD